MCKINVSVQHTQFVLVMLATLIIASYKPMDGLYEVYCVYTMIHVYPVSCDLFINKKLPLSPSSSRKWAIPLHPPLQWMCHWHWLQ